MKKDSLPPPPRTFGQSEPLPQLPSYEALVQSLEEEEVIQARSDGSKGISNFVPGCKKPLGLVVLADTACEQSTQPQLHISDQQKLFLSTENGLLNIDQLKFKLHLIAAQWIQKQLKIINDPRSYKPLTTFLLKVEKAAENMLKAENWLEMKEAIQSFFSKNKDRDILKFALDGGEELKIFLAALAPLSSHKRTELEQFQNKYQEFSKKYNLDLNLKLL